ncbi:LpqB family beta-propeller domain-containing protein [Nocardioides bizhenqiangii]|uniref:LpqB family beta-propeller domain-containing protein n=1 Tax=Nocardioides bizhenqiangii TaxID=3095076 RepID=A0ABZ0ZNU6_9ACTN|nr:LpqB family beta-propeller domain-containing protein [Nocardioides sp. HM61]WQQ25454.1 LpqB family beta-propeller domain-containing protein [Nocardioides sp. HM61]
MNRTRPAVVLTILAVVLLGGCVDLPTNGPVVEVDGAEEQQAERASDFDPRPPQAGASRQEVVNGFLEAMMAWPISTRVAKEYLTDDAAEEWSPGSTVIYTELGTAREDGSTVSIRMGDAALLDESGGWRGVLTRDRSVLRFRLTVENGEFRIIDPMDALVVRTSWFQDRYRQASLFYFDPTAQVLVPEPVFVPVGGTFATTLVTALLAGPPARLRDVVSTFLPSGLSVGLSVVVSDGVAVLDLRGEAPRTSAAEAELMLAQLAATLRQDPSITALRVTLDGEELDLPGAETQYDVGAADEFDPTDTGSEGVLYGLRRGRLVVGGFGELDAVNGPFGRVAHDLASVAVSPGGRRVAAVTGDRRQALVGPLRAPREDGRGIEVLTDGTDLTRPTWDASGRLWLLDRGPGGARLLVSDDRSTVREVEVAGVTGTDARRILVSRDGTRLVALIGDADGDRLVAVRIVLSPLGRVEGAVDPTVIWSVRGSRATDVAWAGPAQVAVLTPTRPGELFELETVAADGATVGVDTLSTIVSGRVVGLAAEPWPETPIYAVARDGLIDISSSGDRVTTDIRARELDYAG